MTQKSFRNSGSDTVQISLRIQNRHALVNPRDSSTVLSSETDHLVEMVSIYWMLGES